jgi:membrane glycosyltransferase
MRRAGYEVRVVPVEEGSYEDNPPTLLDFTKRDLRWCQGNMQYWGLLGEPGLPALSRFQLVAAIFMYLSTAAWMIMVAAGAAIAISGGFQSMHSDLALVLYFVMIGLSMAPKFVGYLDVALTQGGAARYGGRLRLVVGALAETLFSLLLIPVTALRLTIFMTRLVFGQAIIWSGQQRDVYGLSWRTAAAGLFPQFLAGTALVSVFLACSPGTIPWAAPMFSGFLFAVPFAVWTASPKFGAFLARMRLCAIPEEFDPPAEIVALQSGQSLSPAMEADEGALVRAA